MMDYKLFLAVAAVCASAAAGPDRSPCVCARNFAPVCGTDNKTYSNECTMRCHNYEEKANVEVAAEGRCPDEPCICTYEYKPVCATNGVTYPNRCAMLCERKTIPDIDVDREGSCSDPKPAEVACICTMELDEVCGSDRNTYSNPCLLNCATAKNPQLRVDHPGPCDDRVRVAVPSVSGIQVASPDAPQGDGPSQDCVCPKLMRPVCGSDGKYYANDCLMRCAGADITVHRMGNC